MQKQRMSAVAVVAAVLLMMVGLPAFATGSQEPAAIEDVVELEWLYGKGGTINPEMDEIWEEQIEAVIPNLDVDLVVTVQRDLKDQYQVMIAAGDLPNVWNLHYNNTVDKEAAEIYKPLNDLWNAEDYPNLVHEWPEELLRLGGMPGGNIYGIYKWTQPVELMMGIRKDWLDAVGLDVPTTVDELTEVVQAFTFDDPDGNGKDDTYGMAVSKWNAKPLQWMNATWHVHYCEAWHYVKASADSQFEYVEPGFWQPGMVEFIKWMRDRYQEGCVIPDGPVLAGGQIRDEYWNTGRLGIFGVNGAAAVPADLLGKVVVAPPITGPMGEPEVPLRSPVLKMFTILDSVTNEAQARKVLEIWDWFMTDEGFEFNTFGPQGLTWTDRRDDGSPKIDDVEAYQNLGWIGGMPQPPSAKWCDIEPWLWGTPEGEQLVSDLNTWKSYGVQVPTTVVSARPEIFNEHVGDVWPRTWSTATQIMTGELELSDWYEMVEDVNDQIVTDIVIALNEMLAEYEDWFE